MIKMVSLKCPECKANLSIEANRKQCFCQYCGTQIMIDDGSTSHTYRKVDEARLREAEVNEHIRMRELELEEKKYADKQKTKFFKIKLSIVLAIIGVLMMILGISGEGTLSFGLMVIGMWVLLAIAFIWNDNGKK